MLKKNGTVWLCGDQPAKALGDESDCPCNTPGTPAPGTTPGKLALTIVPGLDGVASVATGEGHIIALKGDGTVWAWGANNLNQLGMESGMTQTAPTKLQGLAGIQTLAAGPRANHCLVLKKDGTVWSWGWNKYGQLGDGKTENRSRPAQIPGLTGVKAVACGANHSVILRSDGSVWTWGSNYFGQLGDGTTTDRLRPVRVADLSGAAAVSAVPRSAWP